MKSKPSTVIVLGGGFAGLAAAIDLALEGVQVTLLEREREVGGKAGEVVGEGFRFDTGPSVWTLPHLVTELFERAGKTPPSFVPLEPLCRYHYPTGEVWDVSLDTAKTTAPLTGREAALYLKLRDKARTLYESAAPTFLYNPAPTPRDLLRYGLRGGLRAHPTQTLYELLAAEGVTGKLEPFFLRFATYFGADPYRAPAVLHNIAWVELGLGVFYPRDGIKGVVRQLRALAETLGVDVRTGVQVEALEHRRGRVSAVKTDEGTFGADAYVSNLDIIRTQRLLGRRAREQTLEPSLSGLVLLLGVKGVTPGLEHHNILFPHSYRAEFEALRRGSLPDDPTLYVSISSKSKPDDAPEGDENWFVLANAPALPGLAPRDDAQSAAHLLEVLARRGFDVGNRVRFLQLLTPHDLERFAHRGAIYGVAPHSLLRTLRPRQTLRNLDNLVLAGGTVHPGGGIPLALLSGKHAAAHLLAQV